MNVADIDVLSNRMYAEGVPHDQLDLLRAAVSYTHLTLPTIYSV